MYRVQPISINNYATLTLLDKVFRENLMYRVQPILINNYAK